MLGFLRCLNSFKNSKYLNSPGNPFYIFMTKKEIKLKADGRSIEENVKALRKSGYVPGVVYGNGIENQPLKIKAGDMEKIYSQAGESTLIDLAIGDKPAEKVLINDIQENGIKGKIIHVDFYKVNMAEEVEAPIRLEFIGESRAVKEQGGMLIKNLDEIEVECLPGDLVDHIEVDISGLDNFDDMIKVEDLALPGGMKLVTKPDEVIVIVAAPKSDAEMAAEDAAEKAEDAAKAEDKGEKKEEVKEPEGEAPTGEEAKKEE